MPSCFINRLITAEDAQVIGWASDNTCGNRRERLILAWRFGCESWYKKRVVLMHISRAATGTSGRMQCGPAMLAGGTR